MRCCSDIFQIVYRSMITICPRGELIIRKLYWGNIQLFSKHKINRSTTHKMQIPQHCNFDAIIEYLKNEGVKKGDIVIIHSSYDALEGTNMSPDQIIDALLQLVGSTGTLCMPIIRKYKDGVNASEYLIKDVDVECKYNTRKTVVISGILPYTMMLRPNSVVSRHPLNPMVAIGPLANEMMKHNIDGEKPSPHGINSSWKYCADKNAFIVGLGVDYTHHLTMVHVSEECNNNWPVKDWYRTRKFFVIDKDFETHIEVSERKPKWGTLYLLEAVMKRDFIKNNIIKITHIDNVEVGISRAQDVIAFCRTQKNPTYPYFISKRLYDYNK